MLCKDLDNCISEINAYFNGIESGYPFVVNIDDTVGFTTIMSKIQADTKKKIVRVSDFCNGDEFPDISAVMAKAAETGNNVLVGISQYCMIQGYAALKKAVSEILSLPVNGHTVVLLNGSSGIMKNLQAIDARLDHRIVVLDKTLQNLPKISFVEPDDEYCGTTVCQNIKELLFRLENMDYNSEDAELTAKTHYSKFLFKNSMYSISFISGTYGILSKNFSEIKLSTEPEWGNEKQWNNLLYRLNEHKTFSAVVEDVIGSTANLSFYISDKFENIDSIEAWYLWLAMKVFSTKENRYLRLAIKKSTSPKQLVEFIYMEMLEHDVSDLEFASLYKERKRLIERLPDDNSALAQKYCDHVGQFERNAVYYLTDLTDTEKLMFLHFLSVYNYSDEEILNVTSAVSPELYFYLQKFEFTEFNTKIPSNDTAFRTQLTDYFQEYKIQKVTNRIHENFLKMVNEYAASRPFYKLSPRISIVNEIDKTNAQIHFFDALGVEFLAYIAAKCDKYGLQTTIHIATCELPSITSKNLEFKKFFKTVLDDNGNEILPGTKDLDDLKHHSKTIDYRKCKEPIHLFIELEIIDREIRAIRKMLINEEFEKIIIVSDHGASRLAVRNQSESDLFELDDGHSEHSGRCFKTDTDPSVPEAAYENGYVVLANYDRFKGGRAANVEVHGGATLEETVVPIIEIVKKPEKLEIYITNTYIEFHNKEIVGITIYSNSVLSSPTVVVKELNNSYGCNESIDGKHYKFEIPDIKRSGTFTVELYDGNKLLAKGLEFRAKKAIGTTKDFF